ncbi:MAG: hypothetical protein V7693_16180 [Halopseudomonas sabulinigri]
MTISENIRFRAIGLLSSFQEHCHKAAVSPTLGGASQAPKSSGNNERVIGSEGAVSVAEDTLSTEIGVLDDAGYVPGGVDDCRIDMTQLLCWLNDRFGGKGVSLTTAKCYRRWLASYFDAIGHPDSLMIRNWQPPSSQEAALASDAADSEYLAAKTYDPSRSLVTSDDLLPGNTRYLSFIDRESLSLLLEQLLSVTAKGTPRYQAGPEAALMFTVSMMTGLRPHEWPTARYLELFFDPETKLTLGPVLEVMTLKQSSRREDNPLREKRYLVLDKWPKDQIERVVAFIDQIQGSAEDFDAYYNRARMTLGRAWKRAQRLAIKTNSKAEDVAKGRDSLPQEPLPPKSDSLGDEGNDIEATKVRVEESSYSGMVMVDDTRAVGFYTARHVFAEEIRRSVSLTRFELAAMLGHSLLTNQVYYGPKMESSDREYDFVLPRPWPGDADEIKLWDYKVNPLRTAYMQGDLFGGMSGTESEQGSSFSRDGASSFYLR